jgi:hypothetical protein
MPKTVLELTFVPPTGETKAESKNYDIYVIEKKSSVAEGDRSPLLVTAQGQVYVRKGLTKPGGKVTVTVTQ